MLAHLWRSRMRPRFLSSAWQRAWTKRLLTLPAVVETSRRIQRLERAGARIGPSVFISPAEIAGKLNLFSVGEDTFIGRVEIQVVGEVRIGSHVCINDGVRIFSASHNLLDTRWTRYEESVVIADYVWIASGALILPGVSIGRGAVIGAGAVISRDVPPLALAVGNPARILEGRRTKELSYSPVSLLASYTAWCGAVTVADCESSSRRPSAF